MLGDGGVPACGHGDGHGVDGAEAVDDVEAEEQRDVQVALIDGEMLETIDLLCVGDEEEGADLAFAREYVGRHGRVLVERLLGHLAELVVEGHLADEIGYEGLAGGVWRHCGELCLRVLR